MKHIQPVNRDADRAAHRFISEAIRGLVDDEYIKDALDKAINAATAEYLDTYAAAVFMDCSVEQLEIWRHKGEGPPYCRLGKKRVRYKREDLRAWLDGTRFVPPGR